MRLTSRNVWTSLCTGNRDTLKSALVLLIQAAHNDMVAPLQHLIWGLLLGGPLIAIVKVICDRVESLKPVGELLGR